MTEKLLKKYMQTFIKNLEYEEDGGRSAAIDVLVKLAEILPLDLLAPYYDLVVFACLARIVNEENLEFKANLRKVSIKTYKLSIQKRRKRIKNKRFRIETKTATNLRKPKNIRAIKLIRRLKAFIRRSSIKV